MHLSSRYVRSLACASVGALCVAACTPPRVGGDHIEPIRTEDAFEKNAVSCNAVRPQTEPDLMAWDSTSRANLNRLRQKGIVAVRYAANGCNVELEVLSNCIAKGAYEFAPYSASEHKVAHNANELYAALPIGASRIAGKLKGDRALRTDYMLVGTYAIAPGSTVEEAALQGSDCAKATHVVSAVYVGGFALAAGESRALDAEASLFGFTGGAKSHADVENVTSEGNADACKQAQSDGTESPRCAVPLRIGLLAIKRAGGGETSERTVALATLAAVPPAPLDGGGLKLDADADVLVAYDAALKADARGAADADRAAAAWKSLAGMKKKNPYLTVANERAQRWSEYGAKKKARQAQQSIDTDRLKKILPLESLSLEQKEHVLRDYVRLYGRLAAIDLMALVKPEKDGLAVADRLGIPMGTFPTRYDSLDKLGLSGRPAKRAATECEGGKPQACAALAAAFQAQWVWKTNGSGLPWEAIKKEHAEAALELYEKACEGGDRGACLDRLRSQVTASASKEEKGQAERQLEAGLARTCDEGVAGTGDLERAMESCRELRDLYQSPSMSDRPKALETQRKFERVALRRCEAGVRTGCTALAFGPSFGDRVVGPELKKQGLQLLAALDAKSCVPNTLSDCERAASIYRDLKEWDRANELLLKGAALAHADCKPDALNYCNDEGRFYELAGQPKKAIAVWTPVCQGRDVDEQRGHACIQIADLLAAGGDGLPANRAASIPFYKRACLMLKESPCTRGPE